MLQDFILSFPFIEFTLGILALFVLYGFNFQVVDKKNSRHYYQNKTSIFYSSQGSWLSLGKRPLQQSDPQTFTVLGPYHAKDQYQVYYRHLVIPEADPATFTLLGNYTAVDKDQVYSHGSRLTNVSNQGIRVLMPVLALHTPEEYSNYGENYLRNHQGIYYVEGNPDHTASWTKIPTTRWEHFQILKAPTFQSTDGVQHFDKAELQSK